MNCPLIAFVLEAAFTASFAALAASLLNAMMKRNMRRPTFLGFLFMMSAAFIINDFCIGLLHQISKIK